MIRKEIITRVEAAPVLALAPHVDVRMLATGSLGAQGLTTALSTFAPGAELPYHLHPVSEVIILISGEALVSVEGRRYRLAQYDAVHLPAGTAHAVVNPSRDAVAVFHSSFASAAPPREPVSRAFVAEDCEAPAAGCPESLVRFASAPVYELSQGAYFRDLFAKRLGARGICGGYGLFEPGKSLPCHYHAYDESITIITGTAICQVAGREYELSGCGTACVPTGRPHRFLNRSNGPMAMIWVYAGDEPERTLVDAGYCDGSLQCETFL